MHWYWQANTNTAPLWHHSLQKDLPTISNIYRQHSVTYNHCFQGLPRLMNYKFKIPGHFRVSNARNSVQLYLLWVHITILLPGLQRNVLEAVQSPSAEILYNITPEEQSDQRTPRSGEKCGQQVSENTGRKWQWQHRRDKWPMLHC